MPRREAGARPHEPTRPLGQRDRHAGRDHRPLTGGERDPSTQRRSKPGVPGARARGGQAAGCSSWTWSSSVATADMVADRSAQSGRSGLRRPVRSRAIEPHRRVDGVAVVVERARDPDRGEQRRAIARAAARGLGDQRGGARGWRLCRPCRCRAANGSISEQSGIGAPPWTPSNATTGSPSSARAPPPDRPASPHSTTSSAASAARRPRQPDEVELAVELHAVLVLAGHHARDLLRRAHVLAPAVRPPRCRAPASAARSRGGAPGRPRTARCCASRPPRSPPGASSGSPAGAVASTASATARGAERPDQRQRLRVARGQLGARAWVTHAGVRRRARRPPAPRRPRR